MHWQKRQRQHQQQARGLRPLRQHSWWPRRPVQQHHRQHQHLQLQASQQQLMHLACQQARDGQQQHHPWLLQDHHVGRQ